ncbi:hypothetical protein [Polaribacter sp. NJDZ03]|uniref:hypothetical protein n=1 Tax=Polaribacter sp. NJDZ03 TaxID=2855841 RepID=UPI001C4A2028|nr:hypothetical protein [Polaribacter sp. NJDZ03]
MAKQTQPKVSELIEILIQQLSQFEKTINDRNKILTESISKLNTIQVDFNVEELEEMKESNRKILNKDFNIFHQQTVKNNKELLKIHKNVSSKRLLYLIILNVFLFSVAGISMYVSITNYISQTEYNDILKEKNDLREYVNITNDFFSKNPKTESYFRDWLKK